MFSAAPKGWVQCSSILRQNTEPNHFPPQPCVDLRERQGEVEDEIHSPSFEHVDADVILPGKEFTKVLRFAVIAQADLQEWAGEVRPVLLDEQKLINVAYAARPEVRMSDREGSTYYPKAIVVRPSRPAGHRLARTSRGQRRHRDRRGRLFDETWSTPDRVRNRSRHLVSKIDAALAGKRPPPSSDPRHPVRAP